MATLELHDGQGGVEYVAIARDGTALIGSDPKCDVVLDAAVARPIHARLRWSKGRLKIEATPDARALDLNGRKVAASRLRQGDELRIGRYRLFLLNLGDGAAAEIEKTQVRTPPAASPRNQVDWLRELEVEAPSSGDLPAAEPAAGLGREARESANWDDGKGRRTREGGWRSLRARLGDARRVFAGTDVAPGEERIASSPVVLALVACITLLIVFSGVIWARLTSRGADNQFQIALESYQDGDDLNAIREFDRFLERNGEDERASRARVLRSLAEVRRFTTGAAPAWSEGLDAARGAVDSIGGEAAYGDASAELAELILRITDGLAERASRTADPRALTNAEAALALHARVAGKTAESLVARSRVPARLEAARAAVDKGQARLAALQAMDAGLKAASVAEIYEARDRLVGIYPDLATDREVVQRLTQGNDLIRQAVRFDPSIRPAEIEPRIEPLGPPTSLVLRSVRKPGATPTTGVVVALAEGFAHGLTEADGAPLWQVPVGLASPFPPVLIGGPRPSVVVFDARHDELLSLDARSGAFRWSQPLGEPVHDPPLVLGNDLYQTLPSGKLLRIDLESGELRGTLDCQRPLSRAPVADELGQRLYLFADRANLFILDRDPLACAAVEYVGHESGSIPCAPARIGRYLIAPINDGPTDGHWRVYLLEQEGARVRPIQRIASAGWTWSRPASSGSTIWMTGDRGGVTALAIGAETEKVPFQKIAELAQAAHATGPAFALARSERELWLASSQTSRYDLSPERSMIASAWTVVEAGPALAPIQYNGRLAVLTQQPSEGRGVALWGIDPADGSVVWQTILGASWFGALVAGNDGLDTLGIEGQPVSLTLAKLAEGGFIEQSIPTPGAFRLPPGPLRRWNIDQERVIMPRPPTEGLWVGAASQTPRALTLPSRLAAPPAAWGGGLLLPSEDGLVYLIGPGEGASLADPYVPPYDRERPTRWLEPVVLSAERVLLADREGRLRKLTLQASPRPRLTLEGEAFDLGAAPASPPAGTDQAVIVVTQDGRVRSLSTRDFSPLGTWELAAPLAFGPVKVGDHLILGDTAGHVLALHASGERAWDAELNGEPAGPPALLDEAFWFLDRDGRSTGLAAEDGARLSEEELGILPAGGPIAVGAELAVPVAPGTIQLRKSTPAESRGGDQP